MSVGVARVRMGVVTRVVAGGGEHGELGGGRWKSGVGGVRGLESG